MADEPVDDLSVDDLTAISADDPAPEPVPGPEADLAAFDKGLEAVEPKAEPKAEPEAAKPEAVKPVEAKTEPDAPKPDAAVEKEIGDLHLKDKAATRFREMHDQLVEIPGLREKAQRNDQWEEIVHASSATPTQLNSVLGYLQAINSGEPKAMNDAFDAMTKEVTWLGKQLGREVTGLVDPLADHKDLVTEVDDATLTRARALEIAQQRAQAARSGEQQQRQIHQQQHADAVRQAMDVDIAALNDKLKAADPAFLQKLPLLQPALNIIKANLPPQQWAQAVERAYRELPAMAAPPPKPPISAMPIRPTGSGVPMRREPKTDMEAFQFGLDAMR